MVIVCLKLTYLGCYTAMRYETKIHDVDQLRKRLMQTWPVFTTQTRKPESLLVKLMLCLVHSQRYSRTKYYREAIVVST